MSTCTIDFSSSAMVSIDELSSLIESYLAIIDEDILAACCFGIKHITKIDSIIDQYDLDITQRMEGHQENAEKRRVFVKREVLAKQSLSLTMAKSFLPFICSPLAENEGTNHFSSLDFSDVLASPAKRKAIEVVFSLSLDKIVDDYILSVDTAMSIVHRGFLEKLDNIESKISYFDQELTTHLDAESYCESAAKRRIYVKREIMNRKSEKVQLARHFMIHSFSKGFQMIAKEES